MLEKKIYLIKVLGETTMNVCNQQMLTFFFDKIVETAVTAVETPLKYWQHP